MTTLLEFSGAARPTTLVGAITSSSTSLTVVDATGYPLGSTAPFVVSVDRGVAAEEKILVTRSGNTFTVVTRGYDGTTAAGHGASAKVEHVIDAGTIRDANSHAASDHGKVLGQASIPVNVVGITTGSTLMTVAVPVVAGRKYRVTSQVIVGSASAGNEASHQIRRDGTTVIGADSGVFMMFASSTSYYSSTRTYVYTAGATATVTFTTVVAQRVGSGALTAATPDSLLLVELLG